MAEPEIRLLSHTWAHYHSLPIHTIAFSPDCCYLACVSRDGTISVMDATKKVSPHIVHFDAGIIPVEIIWNSNHSLAILTSNGLLVCVQVESAAVVSPGATTHYMAF